MPRFLADENFDGDVLRNLRRLLPDLEVLRVHDAQLKSVQDELILEWAALHGYVLLTHDIRTMIPYGRERITRGLLFPGMVVIKPMYSIGPTVRDLEILIECTRPDEWENHIWFVPF